MLFLLLFAARTKYTGSSASFTIIDSCSADFMGLGSYPKTVSHANDSECVAHNMVYQTQPDTCRIEPGLTTHTTFLFHFQLILADKYDSYDLTYEGCHVFNPGSFIGNQFQWKTYYPSTGRSESR